MRMRAVSKHLACMLISLCPAGLLGAAHAEADENCLTFSELDIVLEHNHTDGVSELVFFAEVDNDGVQALVARVPDGLQVFELGGGTRKVGMHELVVETVGRPGSRLLLDSFPEGEYVFEGTAASGRCLSGIAALSHDVAPATSILSPADGAMLSRGGVVVAWSGVAEAAAYVVELENEANASHFSIEVPSTTTRIDVPGEWLSPDGRYEVEIGVLTANRNRTNTEISFSTLSGRDR